MAQLKTPFQVPEIENWCRGEGIDPDYAIMVSGISEDTDVSTIEETMHTVKALGRVRVRGRMYNNESQSLIVLCECREKVHAERIPRDVLPAEGSDPWILRVRKAESNASDVREENYVPPESTEQSEESGDIHSPNVLNASTPESIIRAVGDLLAKTTKASGDSSSFRRLRTFSGVIPTPAGEDNLENWMEQAMLMVEECDRSEKEKKLRIVESLRGPALEIIQAVRFTNSNASPKEYLAAVESAFGSSESGEDLYFKFRALRQRHGECLSDFLRRLEKVLIKVVQRDGLPLQSVGKARLEQLIRGATQSDIMLLQLRLRERKQNPPDFLELLHEIKEEEVREAERHKSNPTVRKVHIENEKPNDFSLQDLATEIRDLQSLVAKLAVKTQEDFAPERKQKSHQADEFSEDNHEVKALKKEVKKLRQQVKAMCVQPASTADKEESQEKKEVCSVNFTRPRVAGVKSSEDFFCYRCGGDGHIASKCKAPENEKKVIQKLINSLT